ncbi:MAG: fibronectin type III domain-containing protein [Bacteroidia bacterium]
MRILVSNILLILCFTFFGQTEKAPDFAGLHLIKDNTVKLRWAPARTDLLKAGVQYGYKIERIPFDDFKNGTDNSMKGVVLTQAAIKPVAKEDAQWKELISKNKNSVLMFNALYKANSGTNKELAYALALKSCDLYIDIAKASGLYFEDGSFSPNEVYVYKISLWNAPATFKYTPLLITVNTGEKRELMKLKQISAKFYDRKSIISFTTANTDEDYSGFWIERSDDSTNFSTVNKAPIIHSFTSFDSGKTESSYTDSLPENNKKFYYRVRGISYFGDLSMPSNIVSGKGKKDFTEYPFIDSTTIIKNKTVRLKFSMPEKYDIKELKAFVIMRSDKKKGNYNIFASLSPKQGYFTDEQPMQDNYYKICAININNDSTFSFTTHAKLIDDVPPAIPTGITGKIDTSGNVTLAWDANKENDLLGYRVFRCNSKKEQPVEVTKEILKEPKFSDKITLQTLTKEVYYTVRSVDKVHNNSIHSDFCKLTRPDKIAPVAPVFKEAVYNDSAINLKWLLSTSSDVWNYKLSRSSSANSAWKTIKEWHTNDSLKNYVDTSVRIGDSYRYKLEVYDEAGNVTGENSPIVKFLPAFAPKIKTLKATVDLKKRTISLDWKNNLADVYSYTIYKTKGEGDLRVLKTVNGNIINFTDTELYPGNKYHYTIKATLNSGIESKMSDILIVEF